jgi:hypothetical protein
MVRSCLVAQSPPRCAGASLASLVDRFCQRTRTHSPAIVNISHRDRNLSLPASLGSEDPSGEQPTRAASICARGFLSLDAFGSPFEDCHVTARLIVPSSVPPSRCKAIVHVWGMIPSVTLRVTHGAGIVDVGSRANSGQISTRTDGRVVDGGVLKTVRWSRRRGYILPLRSGP